MHSLGSQEGKGKLQVGGTKERTEKQSDKAVG